MPVPGPRGQARVVPGYRNPGRELPTRFELWLRPGAVIMPGRSPGTMARTLRGAILGAGQVRRFWRQTVNLIPAQAPYSWTRSAPAPGRPVVSPAGLGVTTALRYMTRSVYVAGGTDNSRFAGLHTRIAANTIKGRRDVTVGAGQRRNPPTVRNRLTSFGSRVPPLNQPVQGAQGGQP